MEATKEQLQNVERNFRIMMKKHTLADYEVAIIGMNTACQRMESHNRMVDEINAGNKELEREWKDFLLNEELKRSQKEAESKAKLAANKAASSNVLEPIKKLRKMGEFGKWLNTSGNKFRKQHFNKKYTIEAVNAFLATL